ncbi:MAG: calcium-binding protein [Pseudomonadota bacterium]
MAMFLVTQEAPFNMERMNLTRFWDGGIESGRIVEMFNVPTDQTFERLTLVGDGFAPRAAGWFPAAGTVQRLVYESDRDGFMLDGLNTPVVDFLIDWGDVNAEASLRQRLLLGDDEVYGQMFADVLRGYSGNDQIFGVNGDDDLHGNQGDDTVAGGFGQDWVVGGQGNDRLLGNEDDDLVLGNLGADTAEGGDGADVIRGGQGDDVLRGDAGNDWLSGDRGDDTLSGGAGADTFHTFAGAGVDRVTDFSVGQGDRVLVTGGGSYTLAQVGGDTVVTLDGTQLVLAGVSLSTLPAGWIIGG